jgi:hypothetical protein
MTEFKQELRHMCRNPKCRSKLPTPVSNAREAFCARGCHISFYRHRCLVCEGPIERKTERQLICGKRKCRNALQARPGFGRYLTSSGAISLSKKPVNKGAKQAPGSDRGIDWAIAVNSTHIRAPRRMLDREFGHIPLVPPDTDDVGRSA